MIYKTSLDKTAIVITVGVSLLFVIIIAGQFSLAIGEGLAIPILITTLLMLVYALTFALRPIHYVLKPNRLIIHRLLKDVIIDSSQISSVEYLTRDEMGLVVRTFGVGGLFGYFGKFSSTKIGRMTWYATRRDKTVLIRTLDHKKIILTPDEPERFVSAISSR